MLVEHRGKCPDIHESAYVAPNAVVCGDVTIGENSRILFGAVLVAEGGPVVVGSHCIIMENAVIRGTPRHPTRLGDHVLVGPRAYLTGCIVEDCAFLATGATVFNGARIGPRAEVRINGLVHLRTVLPADAVVPPRSCLRGTTIGSGPYKSPSTFRGPSLVWSEPPLEKPSCPNSHAAMQRPWTGIGTIGFWKRTTLSSTDHRQADPV
jgi:carbonic anhydrase/acetyltransferase-like protein (isoleucine patch superfamily)